MSKARTALVILLTLSVTLTGCVSLFGGEDEVNQTGNQDASGFEINTDTQRVIEERVAALPRNFTLPGQQLLPSETVWLNGTVGPDAAAGFEDRNDRSGNDVNTQIIAEDVSRFLPAGQPAEIRIKLYYQASLGRSADLDIYTSLPGHAGEFAPDNSDEFNWKVAVQTLTVNTVGVQGFTPLIGVQVANGKVAPGQSMEYALKVDFHYAKDVLTPHHPYAFTVPDNATGIILESDKVAGDEHVRSHFAIIGPDDQLVRFIKYDDISVPTESIFIPVKQAGEHVFYAYNMTGGFLSVSADAPPEDRPVRALQLSEERTPDISGPAPGMVAKNPTRSCTASLVVAGANCDTGITTPFQPGHEATFSVDGAFPLRVIGYVGQEDGTTAAGATQVRILSPNGLVYDYVRAARLDSGGDTVGWTADEHNTVFTPENLATGTFTIQIANDSPAEVGHIVVSYQR